MTDFTRGKSSGVITMIAKILGMAEMSAPYSEHIDTTEDFSKSPKIGRIVVSLYNCCPSNMACSQIGKNNAMTSDFWQLMENI